MANKRISDLSELTTPTGKSILPITHQGATRKITLDNLFTYVDTNYFKSGKAPNVTDNQGYSYSQFKNISGNFIISGSQMARISTGIFQVDNSGLFRNYFSGKNCFIDNLSLQTGTLQEVNIKNLTITGNVSSLNVTGNLVNITGQVNVNSGIKFINSSFLNPLSFGQTPKIYATGNGSDLAILADTTYIAKNLLVQETATFRNNFSVTGNQINFYGNIVLGSDQSHTVQLNGGWVGDIKPANDWLNEADTVFYDLGNPVARWRNVYAGKGVFHDSITLSGKLNVSGDTNISGRTTIGKDSIDSLRVNATSTFTAPKVYIQNDLEVSGAIKIGDISNDLLDISSTATFRAPNTFFLQNVKINNTLDVSGDIRASGKIILEGDSLVFSPDVTLFRPSSGVLQTDSVLFIKNDLIVSGHATLGNGPDDDIHLSGRVDSNIIPNINNTYDIGSTGLLYKNIYSASTGFFNNLNLSGNLNVSGVVRVDNHFSAIIKSFLIDHPSQQGKKLQYSCLEGPENGVYVRGSTSENEIILPNYWKNLVDEKTITVNLTPVGHINSICVLSCDSYRVTVSGHDNQKYFYTVFAERKDVEKLKVEI